MPPLGLLTLAALLPGDWELRLADLNTRATPPGDWDWAELVMLSGMIVQRDGLLNLIREAKQRHKTVVVGGPYATSVPRKSWTREPIFWCRARVKSAYRSGWRRTGPVRPTASSNRTAGRR